MSVRALAAEALADIALSGHSLREVADRAFPRLPDSRDRALLTALLNEGARWWPRYDAAIDRLLDKSIRRNDPKIHALLVIGLIQLEVLELPAYAAVAATVEAVRELRRPRLAGLVNAVLRRWQRERETLNVALDATPATRHAHPAWLAAVIARDWPGQAEAIMAASNVEPPLMLRVNRNRATREDVVERLTGADQAVELHPWLADGLVLPHSTDVTRLPGFAQGDFAVQDGAAQVPADLLGLANGQRVLDACAAPGGKACHALERANVHLVAVESEAKRIPRIRQNLERLGLRATVVTGDAGDASGWWDGKAFDRVMIDAPCSATGVIRRRPDVRLHRREADIPALIAQQARILAACWELLAPGGSLLYVTCSILRAENEGVVGAFVAERADVDLVPLSLPVGQAAGIGWQILPGEGDLDGMYYALLRKR
ncbi:16S rRNA (cytosine(967)-C(5))-methyltransferase [Luteibacter rhizovicinus DSM 16549]|uniref:16S rRNA (cytosine(967)-C(5))-methyltransferase n=1 Tax=Luteibacter rhizovicinus DSM 16549 TaxID=1440763 RepID=A0A0G9HAQ0_9GAMM|nr:16S rRNA (cytosine(967)-C(5))-methyltransferase [Luteibacter rhizovicinus DSM 16549]KLD64752.1 16S rRNA methyltransferase [Luteibacter rhizovicinus DSM 16549]KLD79064.1 16S rRNA methyltransferase [Xanthomonas hyacinthi DSM 19077]